MMLEGKGDVCGCSQREKGEGEPVSETVVKRRLPEMKVCERDLLC